MPILQIKVIITLALIAGISLFAFSQEKPVDTMAKRVDREVSRLMEQGDIPGLSLVIIKGDQQMIRSYGYADLARKTPVNARTLFEIGSCSKAFTALAVARLIDQQQLKLTDDVATYIPWLRLRYKQHQQKITIGQLLHHTSGIPWKTIALIPQTDQEDALEKTVKTLVGLELNHLPGKKYEYATINYDVLALVIQQVTKQPFEEYVQKNIIDELQLSATTIGRPANGRHTATGYKIGFFSPRPYVAPAFKGNNAAGYVISDAEDMSRWLKFQMGLVAPELYHLAQFTQQRDETVPPHGTASYAMGWNVSLSGDGEIAHGGLNPNYTAYIAFRHAEKIGVAVLANSNSGFTPLIATNIMKLYAGDTDEQEESFDGGNAEDKAFSMLSFASILYILIAIVFGVVVITDIVKGKRKYKSITGSTLMSWGAALLLIAPFIYGIYILPAALSDFTWDAIIVWGPISLPVFMVLLLLAIGISYILLFITRLFPEKNAFKSAAPAILLMSILSGISNLIVIIMVTSALNAGRDASIRYLVFYYLLAIAVYLLGRRFVQIRLIRLTTGLIYDLRISLIKKMFSTSYQKFEKIDRGRVYTALNDDVDTIGESANMVVTLATSSITGIGAFLYLGSIAFWATLVTIFLVGSISLTYYYLGRRTQIYFEQARDTRNGFIHLINGMIDGFKEISLHRNKKIAYKEDVEATANEYRIKMATANIRFANAFIVGETLLVALLGVLSFIVPRMFPGMKFYTIMSFVVVLLYLIGPINAILGSVPAIMRLRVAWKRIRQFQQEIPADIDLNELQEPIAAQVESLEANGITFQYKNKNDQHTFAVGPVHLKVKKGEILFIVGGNGSGKTTLAKLLTGLYKPDQGELKINNNVVKPSRLSEYFSAIFSPLYLFDKLYDIDTAGKSEEIRKYLEMLDLQGKVQIEDNRYSTIALSTGQRKRLALLQCYMEDAPICLFDEWAADQDPEYRYFFYRTLLPMMRNAGKIVIAITHDEHYFDVADRVLKMNEGMLETYVGNISHVSTADK
jgi:putative pyoverdin transport system ATP-binding/permease protein